MPSHPEALELGLPQLALALAGERETGVSQSETLEKKREKSSGFSASYTLDKAQSWVYSVLIKCWEVRQVVSLPKVSK